MIFELLKNCLIVFDGSLNSQKKGAAVLRYYQLTDVQRQLIENTTDNVDIEIFNQ